MTYLFQPGQTYPMARPLSVWTFSVNSPRTREVAARDSKKLKLLCVLPAYFKMEFIGPANGIDNHTPNGESYWFKARSSHEKLEKGTMVLVHANHCDARRPYSVQTKHVQWLNGWKAAMLAVGYKV